MGITNIGKVFDDFGPYILDFLLPGDFAFPYNLIIPKPKMRLLDFHRPKMITLPLILLEIEQPTNFNKIDLINGQSDTILDFSSQVNE